MRNIYNNIDLLQIRRIQEIKKILLKKQLKSNNQKFIDGWMGEKDYKLQYIVD